MNAAYLEDTRPEEFKQRTYLRRTYERWRPVNVAGWVMMILAALMSLQLVVRGAAYLSPAEAQPQIQQVSYSAEVETEQCLDH
ncbi:MAG: hypothetical protein NXH70_02530 [Hyphomonas sp.]|nr:hypothetical protein [Hyphomonas sp.]